jgi:hypothetical protein
MDIRIVKVMKAILTRFHNAGMYEDHIDILASCDVHFLNIFPGYKYKVTDTGSYTQDVLMNFQALMSADKATLNKWAMTAEEREGRIEEIKNQIQALQNELKELS